jgi:hypothetical protein
MKRSLILLSSLVAALAATAACSVERTSSVLAPSSAAATAAVAGKTSSSPSLLGTWVLQSTVSTSTVSTKAIASLPDFSSCTNFQWTVTTQTATEASGKFSADCAGGVSIVGTITGRLGGAVIPIVLAGALTRGSDSCAFSLAGEGTPITQYEFRITYSGTTCVGPIQGANTLRLAQPTSDPTPAPPPAPGPAPAPAPAPVPSNGDQLDLHQVIVRGPGGDVANWPVTTTIRVLDFNSGGVFVDFAKKDGPDRWPDVVPPGWGGSIQYTIWMVVNHGGQWYTAGGVEFWHGLDRGGGPPSMYAQNWYYNAQVWGPLDQHQPSVGEQVGFFVTAGDQRAKDVRLVTERSNVVVVPFPSDGGAYYPF